MAPRTTDRSATPRPAGVLHSTRRAWWGAFLALWTVQAAIYGVVGFYRDRGSEDPSSFGEAMFVGAFDWYLWGAICVLCFWIARRLPLDRYRWRTLVPALLLSGVVIMLGRGAADHLFIAALGWEQQPFIERTVGLLPGRLILITLFFGLGYAVEYVGRYQQRELSEANLRAELATAQLQMLKVQLHPHFLFNTLHAISSLMYVDPSAADRMLVRLSELLRRTLQTMDAQQVTLAEELSFLDPYLEIEKMRLGDRLQVEMAIDPATLDALVPHLILQPLVENAVRHGISPKVEGGTLRIATAARQGVLSITIADSGVGPADPTPGAEGGVGLRNTRSRLRHLHGERGTLDLTLRPGGGAEATLTLPVTLSPPPPLPLSSLPPRVQEADRPTPALPVG